MGAKGRISFFVAALWAAGCGAPDLPARQKLNVLPDTRMKGEWVTLYREPFDTSVPGQDWTFLQGPGLDKLVDRTDNAGWSVGDGRLTGVSPFAIALRSKTKFAGDVDITIRLAHPVFHRRIGMVLGRPDIQEGYGLHVNRHEVRLTRMDLRNTVNVAYLTHFPIAEEAELRFLKEGGRISIFVNGVRAIDYVDFSPPVSEDFGHLFLTCMESRMEIRELEVRGKQNQEDNPDVRKMVQEFQNGHPMIFLDQFGRLPEALPDRDRSRMEAMALQAAFAAEKYSDLENAPKTYPYLSSPFTAYMRFAGLLKQGKQKEVEAFAAEMQVADPDLQMNLVAMMSEEIRDAVRKNDPARADGLYDMLLRMLRANPEMLYPLLMERSVDLAAAGENARCYQVMNDLAARLPPRGSKYISVIVAWSSFAKRFSDAAEFERLLKMAREQLKNERGCLSWLYVLKGESLMSRGDMEGALTWLNRVIKEFPDEVEPWLWAQTSRAKILKADRTIEPWIPELKRIASEHDVYQKPQSILQEIIRTAEQSRARGRQEAEIRAKTRIRSIRASSEEEGLGGPYALVDGSRQSRWGSEHGIDPTWVMIEFETIREFDGIKIFWEVAAAREYDVLMSLDGKSWETVATESAGQENATGVFSFNHKPARYLKILMKRRVTQWGYSIWEIEWF